jgi:LAO/AO transport system kinase
VSTSYGTIPTTRIGHPLSLTLSLAWSGTRCGHGGIYSGVGMGQCRQLATYSVEALERGLLRGDRAALAQAITLIESSRSDHKKQSQTLLNNLAAKGKNGDSAATDKRSFGHDYSLRLGIAGPPGAGKSTFIEALGMRFIAAGHRVAVIPVDPSSHLSGGSLLG